MLEIFLVLGVEGVRYRLEAVEQRSHRFLGHHADGFPFFLDFLHGLELVFPEHFRVGDELFGLLAELFYHLGQLRIPNMRHLDMGFPGNLSVVNPHTLSGIEIHDHYGSGPLGQGLATSVQYIPEQTPGEWGIKGSMGLTVQEVVLDMPWFFWDSFRISFRRLDPEMLKNLGEKFFTEFRKRGAECDDDDDCRVKSSDPFDLSAYDVYAQLNGSDSLGDTWALRTLYSYDEYAVRQDTATKMDKVNSVNIISGEQEYLVLGAEYNSRFGTSVHAGFVREYLSDTLRDTTGFRERTSNYAGETSFIDAYAMWRQKIWNRMLAFSIMTKK